MSAVIGWVLKQIAEGKWGSGPQKLYAFLQGKKTAIAAVLGVLYGALQTAQGNGACALLTGKVTCSDLSSWLGAAAAFDALSSSFSRLLTVGAISLQVARPSAAAARFVAPI